MPGKHALLSASGASRWMECPPSARLEETFPESSSSYADEGTFAHSLAELLLRRQLGWITERKYSEVIVDYHANPYYSHDLHDHVEGYVAFVMEKYNEVPGSKIWLEKRLDMRDWIEEGFGTSDVVILQKNTLLCIDLKFGKGVPVSAVGNKQGRLYLLGALAALDFVYDINHAVFIIYQPRLDSISQDRNYVPELELWAKLVLKPAAEKAYAGQGEYNPGDHCRFCRAKGSCKALANFNMEAVKYQIEKDQETEKLRETALLNDEEISKVLRKADLFKNWLDAVKENAFDQAVKGKKWPGFKLVEGRSNRVFKNMEQVEFTLLENDYTLEQIYNKKIKSFEDLNKLMGKLKFDSILTPLMVKPPGAPALVPIEDKRPEINNEEKVKAMFDD